MGSQFLWSYQVEYLLDALSSPAGIAGACILILLFVISFTQRGRWIALGALLYVTTLSYDGSHFLENILIPPLQQIRGGSVPLTVVLLAFMLAPTVASLGRAMHTPVLGGALAFFLFQFLYVVRMIAAGNYGRSVPAMMIYATTFLTLALGLPRWLRSQRDMHALLRTIASVAFLFVLGTTAQLMVNQSAIVFNQRLNATTGNPQHAAVIISVTLGPVLYLLTLREERKVLRLVWGLTAGMLITFLLWTGSRTGVLMSLVVVGLLFRLRLSRLLGAGIVAAVVVLVTLQTFDYNANTLARLTSTVDTRSATWERGLEGFWHNPLFGDVSAAGVGVLENSYLSAADNTGIVGLSLLGLSTILVVAALIKIQRSRRRLGQETMLADLAVAVLVSMYIGAFFEGFLLGTTSTAIFMVYICFAMVKYFTEVLDTGPEPAGVHGIEMAGEAHEGYEASDGQWAGNGEYGEAYEANAYGDPTAFHEVDAYAARSAEASDANAY